MIPRRSVALERVQEIFYSGQPMARERKPNYRPSYCVAEYAKDGSVTFRDPTPEELKG